jgi:hypothetical protein
METADFSFSTAYLTTTEFWDAGGHGMGDLNEDVRGEQARVDKETPYARVSAATATASPTTRGTSAGATEATLTS